MFNPLECTACGGQKPPCHYFVNFPCPIKCGTTQVVTNTKFNVIPSCTFANSCIYKGDGVLNVSANCSRGQEAGVISDAPSVVPWTLDITASPATLIYYDGTITIVYTAVAAWDCYNPNTLALTSVTGSTNCAGLPPNVCVTPDLVSEIAFCIPSAGELYDSEADRIACCDPDCDTMLVQISIQHGAGGDTCTSTATVVGSLTGATSPSGPSRMLCCTFSFGNDVTICAVFYCSVGTWYVDVYCNDPAVTSTRTFVATLTASSQCCPLGGYTALVAIPFFTAGTVNACFQFGSPPGRLPTDCRACSGTCLYNAVVDLTTPTGFQWNDHQSFNPSPCAGPCMSCPVVDSAFNAAHSYPMLITDTLNVNCVHN